MFSFQSSLHASACRTAFTLVELLVVIAIIGLIAGGERGPRGGAADELQQ